MSRTARATTSSSAPGSTDDAAADSRARTVSRTSASSTARRTSTRIRAESLANKMAELDAKKALDRERGRPVKGASAAPGSIRAQRADFYENYEGRYLSIEANVDGVTYTGSQRPARYNGPTLMAEWYDAQPAPRSARATLDAAPGPGVTPNLLPVPLPDLPARRQGRQRPGAGVDQGRLHQRRRRHARREGMDLQEPAAQRGDLQVAASSRATTTRVDAYQKMRDLATEFPNISEADEPAGEDVGLPAPGRDDARLRQHEHERAERDHAVRRASTTRTFRSAARRRRAPRSRTRRSSSPRRLWVIWAATRSPRA